MDTTKMSYEQLPKEIWKEISMVHYGTYNILVRCSKKFQLEDDFIKSHFVVTKSYDHIIETRLPNGWLHSKYDEPALVFYTSRWYYKNNKLHRGDNLPAVVRYEYGSWEWWIHGVQCYENGDPM
jgi:hypothetical protein